MKTITLLNEKGGVGKTTLAVHLGMGLAAQGHNVMLVDADAQGHSTIRSGFEKAPGLYDLLIRDGDWSELTRKVEPKRYAVETWKPGALYLMPSNKETRNIATSTNDGAVFARRLEELGDTGSVDIVIIDTSPTPSLLTASLLVASDYVLIPTELAFSSFDGLVESIKTKQGTDAGRKKFYQMPPIEILGIVPTMYRANTNDQSQNLKSLKDQFGALVWQPIPLRTLWTETEGTALPVWKLDPKHEASEECWQFIHQVERGIYVPA
jgi:chromosome partitioning protein